MKKLMVLAALCMSASAFAQTSVVGNGVANNGNGSPPHHERNPAVESALHECASSVTKDANGRPDHEAMRACMQSKGFNPPAHHEGQRPQQ